MVYLKRLTRSNFSQLSVVGVSLWNLTKFFDNVNALRADRFILTADFWLGERFSQVWESRFAIMIGWRNFLISFSCDRLYRNISVSIKYTSISRECYTEDNQVPELKAMRHVLIVRVPLFHESCRLARLNSKLFRDTSLGFSNSLGRGSNWDLGTWYSHALQDSYFRWRFTLLKLIAVQTGRWLNNLRFLLNLQTKYFVNWDCIFVGLQLLYSFNSINLAKHAICSMSFVNIPRSVAALVM